MEGDRSYKKSEARKAALERRRVREERLKEEAQAQAITEVQEEIKVQTPEEIKEAEKQARAAEKQAKKAEKKAKEEEKKERKALERALEKARVKLAKREVEARHIASELFAAKVDRRMKRKELKLTEKSTKTELKLSSDRRVLKEAEDEMKKFDEKVKRAREDREGLNAAHTRLEQLNGVIQRNEQKLKSQQQMLLEQQKRLQGSQPGLSTPMPEPSAPPSYEDIEKGAGVQPQAQKVASKS
jgi:chromosome segregation ATPase